jgi:hypothetical protein
MHGPVVRRPRSPNNRTMPKPIMKERCLISFGWFCRDRITPPPFPTSPFSHPRGRPVQIAHGFCAKNKMPAVQWDPYLSLGPAPECCFSESSPTTIPEGLYSLVRARARSLDSPENIGRTHAVASLLRVTSCARSCARTKTFRSDTSNVFQGREGELGA